MGEVSKDIGCASRSFTCFFGDFADYFVELFDIWFGKWYCIVCIGNAGLDNCVENVYFLF